MQRPKGYRPSYSHEADMYDENPSRQRLAEQQQHHHQSPHSHEKQELWKDHSRNQYHGQDSDRRSTSNEAERGRWAQQNEVIYVSQQDKFQETPSGERSSRYHDRDREGYRSPRYESRSRSRSRSPYYGARPSRTIILEGIPLNMTQEDTVGTLAKHSFLAFLAIAFDTQIFNEIQHSFKTENLEEIRLIKDKKTGLSRQFAFAQFTALENARSFLDRYYPTIQLFGSYGANSGGSAQGAVVRIAYSREKEERERPGKGEDDWKCDICYLANYSHRTMCFRCHAPRTHPTSASVVGVAQPRMSAFSGFATTGDSDVSPDNTASQFLLFRGLEPGVNEELLAKGVTKLYKTSGSPNNDPPMAKKMKISSTSSDATLGAKNGSLRRVLLVRDRKNNDSWRYGFAEFNSVEDAQAAMAKYNASDKFTISSKPVLISYIHAGVFVPVLQAPALEFEKFTFSPLLNPSVKLMYWDEAGHVSELVMAQDDRSALATAKENLNSKLAAAAAKEGLVNSTKDAETKLKKRKAEKDSSATSKKVVAPHLQFWSNRHAELHGLSTAESDEPEEDSSSKAVESVVEVSPPQSFADFDRKCCLLCSRQFKTEAEVNKHERMSQLHRDNMLNDDLKKKALAKLANSGAATAEGDSSTYRDRAKERRQAFNQPKQPAAQHHRAPKESSSPSQSKEEDVAPAQSKGAALLGKMGWTAGEGLGAQGTGRKDAIKTELFIQGVGLGAQGGKVGDAIEEAERSTRGSYADFVSKSKDKAKERFQGMS